MSGTLAMTLLVTALIVTEAKGWRTLRALTKLSASTLFCAVAWSLADVSTPYDRWVLVALAFSWLGDALLLSSRSKVFLGGLVAFLLGHLAYAAAFWSHGASVAWLVGGLLAFGLVARAVWRWLGRHVESAMRGPVVAYIVVITTMVSLALAATAAGGTPRILAGAVAFFVSDLAVARDRFVAPGWTNRLWGLPLYYGAQLCLAHTIVD